MNSYGVIIEMWVTLINELREKAFKIMPAFQGF